MPVSNTSRDTDSHKEIRAGAAVQKLETWEVLKRESRDAEGKVLLRHLQSIKMLRPCRKLLQVLSWQPPTWPVVKLRFRLVMQWTMLYYAEFF
jgi:hypothetical protein